MNLIVFPFHDYRKSQNEGFRTRDGHFMVHYPKSIDVSKILVINRPYTLFEIIYKKQSWKTKGKIVVKKLNKRLIKIDSTTFVIDILSFDLIKPLFLGKRWFWESYSKKGTLKFIKYAVQKLDIQKYNIIAHTPQCIEAILGLRPQKIIFDAFDNWLKIPSNKKYVDLISKSYVGFSNRANYWITNSEENKNYYIDKFNANNIEVIKNGVDPDYFNVNVEIPTDLKNIKKPIVGFAGKITHLIDVELINYLTLNNSDKSFVFIGSILDKLVFDQINKSNNFYYLGDKHYKNYPAYLKYFDVCIIPYLFGNKAHGGDSIKFYEYLAAYKTIVTTPGNGVFKYNNNVFICGNKGEFSQSLDIAINHKLEKYEIKSELTWQYKTARILKLLKQ